MQIDLRLITRASSRRCPETCSPLLGIAQKVTPLICKITAGKLKAVLSLGGINRDSSFQAYLPVA